MSIHQKKVLVVDDDASLRLLARKILDTAGCIVYEADSVRTAILQIQKNPPDLIILDLNMPNHDGFIFLKVRLQTKPMDRIPVLVLSANKKRATIEKALALGATQFLEKPLNANYLLQKLRFLFFETQTYTYVFPPGEFPTARAEIRAEIIGKAESQLKVSSIVKLDFGSPLEIEAEDFVKKGGKYWVCKVDHRHIETQDGVYNQVLSLVGLSAEEKERFLTWQRQL